MPLGVVAPVFPRASPTCACQSSAAAARPGAAASRAISANSRTCNPIVILPQLSHDQFDTDAFQSSFSVTFLDVTINTINETALARHRLALPSAHGS